MPIPQPELTVFKYSTISLILTASTCQEEVSFKSDVIVIYILKYLLTSFVDGNARVCRLQFKYITGKVNHKGRSRKFTSPEELEEERRREEQKRKYREQRGESTSSEEEDAGDKKSSDGSSDEESSSDDDAVSS